MTAFRGRHEFLTGNGDPPDLGICAMDVGSLVSSLLAARMAQMQLAIAARLARSDPDPREAVSKLVNAAEQNMSQLGRTVDISA